MGKKTGLLCFFTSLFMPLFPMLFLFVRNSYYLSLWHVLALSGILMLSSALLCLLVRFIFKSPFVGLMTCLAAWVVFFLYGPLYYTYGQLVRHWVFLLASALIVLAVMFLSARLGKGRNTGPICLVVSVLLAVLLLQNLVPAVNAEIYRQQGMGSVAKTDYYIDDTTPTPNIYWIHCDGMLGFAAMEKYFGDSQEEFAAALRDRGFTINWDAYMETGHSTPISVTSLFCSDYYDNTLSETIREGVPHVKKEPDRFKYLYFNSPVLYEQRKHNELTTALQERGYHTGTISSMASSRVYPPITDMFYDISIPHEETPVLKPGDEPLAFAENVEKLGELRMLMDGASMLRVVSVQTQTLLDAYKSGGGHMAPAQSPATSETGFAILNGLGEAQQVLEEPRFIITLFGAPHRPWTLDENGQLHDNDPEAPSSYPAQHKYSVKLLLQMLDEILEKDPEAVIVLQADHGLHGLSAHTIMTELNTDNEGVLEIWNGVLSAVRVPEAYGGLEEPLDPLNISRYLVNEYVGRNYEYIAPERLVYETM